MVELIRRLDRSRFDVHVACFHRRGPLASLVAEEVDIDRGIPAGRFRPPRDGAQRAGVRLVVPPHRRPHRPYLRALREHLRPACGRARRRRRARRQPARDSHAGQDARTPALPAAGVQGGPRRGRELGCRRGATPPRRRARRGRFARSPTASTATRLRRRARSRRGRGVASSRSPTCGTEKGHDTLIAAIPQVIEPAPGHGVRVRRRRPAAGRASRAV